MHTIERSAIILLAGLAFAGLAFAGLGQPAFARPDAPAVRGAEPRIALVIGNANYAEALKLANPANDAALIGATLRKLGFDVILLTDAAQKPMQKAIVDFGERLAKAGPDATGLFYYAGHGVQVDGVNYLIPTDADITREADIEIDSVQADMVLKQIAFAGSRVNILILDSCRNNPLARDFRSVAANQGFAEIRSKPKGTFISYSTAPGEVAVDGADGHSPFAAALAEAMQQPGVDLPEVFQRVREKVLAATEERQTPWDSSSLVKSFYFVPPAADRGDAMLAAAPAPARASAQLADATSAPAADPVMRAAEAPAPAGNPAMPAFVADARLLYARPGSRLRAEPSTGARIVSKPAVNAALRAVARSADGLWWQVATGDGDTAYVHRQAVSDVRLALATPPRLPVPTMAVNAPPAAPRVELSERAATGIGFVDNALGWLASAASSGGSATPPNTTRATR